MDVSASLGRQKMAFLKVYKLVQQDYHFTDKNQVLDYFTRLTGLFKNFNYAAENSPEFIELPKKIDQLADSMDVSHH